MRRCERRHNRHQNFSPQAKKLQPIPAPAVRRRDRRRADGRCECGDALVESRPSSAANGDISPTSLRLSLCPKPRPFRKKNTSQNGGVWSSVHLFKFSKLRPERSNIIRAEGANHPSDRQRSRLEVYFGVKGGKREEPRRWKRQGSGMATFVGPPHPNCF